MIRFLYLTNVTRDGAWQDVTEMMRTSPGNIIHAGPPQATPRHTVAELAQLGMVGLYRYMKVDETDPTGQVLELADWPAADTFFGGWSWNLPIPTSGPCAQSLERLVVDPGGTP